jgi:hypothetical protein
MKKGTISALAIFSMVSIAHAVTPTGFAGDDIVAAGYNSFTQVWIPVIALAALMGLLGALMIGYKIPQKVIALIFIIVLLGGGLAYLSSWSGGTIAASAELREDQR